MVSDEPPAGSGGYGTPPGVLARTWQATLFLGALTLILGIIVSFHPTGSLNVLAVLLGVLMIFSGIFHLIRVFDPAEPHRIWLGIAGLLFIVIGVVLIRHLHLTRSLIGLIIGITWIVQGLAALIGGISGGAREGRAWWIIFGVVSLIAGIVVASAPASSLNVPGRPARDLVHHHGHLRDHRRVPAPPRPAHHAAGARITGLRRVPGIGRSAGPGRQLRPRSLAGERTLGTCGAGLDVWQ